MRSLQCKINELSCIVCDLKPDIVILSETWCNESISSAILQIPGFNIDESLRIDRTETVNGIGGGIIVYVRNGLTVLSNDKINYSFNQYCSFDILKSDSESLNTIAAYSFA